MPVLIPKKQKKKQKPYGIPLHVRDLASLARSLTRSVNDGNHQAGETEPSRLLCVREDSSQDELEKQGDGEREVLRERYRGWSRTHRKKKHKENNGREKPASGRKGRKRKGKGH